MLFETMEIFLMSSKVLLKQVAVRFEPELHQRLQEAADRDRRPLASLIRKICAEATAKQEQSRAA
jgi:predicted DNA-binding protein